MGDQLNGEVKIIKPADPKVLEELHKKHKPHTKEYEFRMRQNQLAKEKSQYIKKQKQLLVKRPLIPKEK